MSIIKSHDITIFGGNEQYNIEFLPLSDEFLPYLYKWNSDPEVLYWNEGDDVTSYSRDEVHQIYGSVSQNALCFAIKVNGNIIGECWLQKMNLPKVKAMYTDDLDVRRIDVMIGEKSYWGKGIGTLFIKMLVDYAFGTEQVDVLHCICYDYNIRSRRVLEKNGFSLVWKKRLLRRKKGKFECHWRLTRDEYAKL